jgi:hypothetical protein
MLQLGSVRGSLLIPDPLTLIRSLGLLFTLTFVLTEEEHLLIGWEAKRTLHVITVVSWFANRITLHALAGVTETCTDPGRALISGNFVWDASFVV